MQLKKRGTKAIAITLFVTSIVGYLIYTGIRDTMTYYLSVPEVLAGTVEVRSEILRVGGNVNPESVRWDSKALKLLFKMGDDNATLEVDYQGVVPDSFKPGREVIIEGKYQGNGQFTATAIMPKCASKYE